MTERHEETAENARLTAERTFPDGSYEHPLEVRLKGATMEFSHPRLGIKSTNKHYVPLTTEEAHELLALRARIAELETLVATLIDRIDDWMVPCPDCNGEGSTERGCSRHGGGCDCEQRTASMTCDRCNGDGQIELVPKGLKGFAL